MTLLSPLTRKRLSAFRRTRRAWYSLLALGGIFVFCLCADWVCPCDPRAVVDPASLEKYREPVVVRAYDIRTARASILDDGSLVDFEGPEDVRKRLASPEGLERLSDEYVVRQTRRDGFTRVFLSPRTPPTAISSSPPTRTSSPSRRPPLY